MPSFPQAEAQQSSSQLAGSQSSSPGIRQVHANPRKAIRGCPGATVAGVAVDTEENLGVARARTSNQLMDVRQVDGSLMMLDVWLPVLLMLDAVSRDCQ